MKISPFAAKGGAAKEGHRGGGQCAPSDTRLPAEPGLLAYRGASRLQGMPGRGGPRGASLLGPRGSILLVGFTPREGHPSPLGLHPGFNQPGDLYREPGPAREKARA